ncbi:hypothetical protein [Sphingobacterium thalpophilum]|uniref:hypothetical protein n=1 Tax=Sphingobacterium thalpophilum TaxID=259 RepID=UPI0031D15793
MLKSKALVKVVIFLLTTTVIILIWELARRRVGSFGGSYPFVETWKIDHSIEDVEINLGKLHRLNPSLFNDTTQLVLAPDFTGHWKKIDFYYTDRDEIVQVLIRGFGSHTNISLYRFTNKNNGMIRLMNRDFNYFNNRHEKELFENRILKYL